MGGTRLTADLFGGPRNADDADSAVARGTSAQTASRRLELAGRTFGKWTVLSAAAGSGEKLKWNCRCTCGTARAVRAGHLVSGRSRSCGCIGPSQDAAAIAAALTVGLDDDAGDAAVFGESGAVVTPSNVPESPRPVSRVPRGTVAAEPVSDGGDARPALTPKERERLEQAGFRASSLAGGSYVRTMVAVPRDEDDDGDPWRFV